MHFKALQCVRSDNVAVICAWCPDAKQASEWAEQNGKDQTHGQCDECKKKMKDQLDEQALLKRLNHEI